MNYYYGQIIFTWFLTPRKFLPMKKMIKWDCSNVSTNVDLCLKLYQISKK